MYISTLNCLLYVIFKMYYYTKNEYKDIRQLQ